jgi:hypothetical protein
VKYPSRVRISYSPLGIKVVSELLSLAWKVNQPGGWTGFESRGSFGMGVGSSSFLGRLAERSIAPVLNTGGLRSREFESRTACAGHERKRYAFSGQV